MSGILKRFNKAADEQPFVGMVFYAVLGFLRPAIYIFLLPLYLSVFSETEYGLYDLMIVTGNLIMIVATLRLSNAMLTQYYDYLGNHDDTRTYLGSLFSSSILLGLGFILLAYLFGETIFDLVFKSEEVSFFPFGFTILLYAVLSEINTCYFIFLKNEKNLLRYAFIILTQILGVILLQFICIIILELGVQGALIGMLAANVITTLMIILMEKGILTFQINWDMIKLSFKFSLNLIPYFLIYWVLTKGGKIVLERFADLSTVGLFALLMSLVGVLILIVDSVVNGVRPFLFEQFAQAKNEGRTEKISLLTKMMVNVPLVGVPIIVWAGNNIGLITSKEHYWQIGEYATFGSLVTYFLVYGKLFYQQLIFVKRSDLVTIISFVVMVALVIGFYFLVPEYKIWGVLVTTLFANVVMAILMFVVAQRYLFVRYSFQSILLFPIIVFILLFGMEWWLVDYSAFSRTTFGWIQLLVLLIVIGGLNYSSVQDYLKLFGKANTKTA